MPTPLSPAIPSLRAPPALTNHKLFLLLKKKSTLIVLFTPSALHRLTGCKQLTCFCKNRRADSTLSEWWKWLLDLWWGFKLLLPALVDAATPISVSGKHKNISMAGQYWNQTNIVYTAAAELTSLKHFGTGEVTGGCLGGNSTASLIPSHPQPSPCMSCLSAPSFPSYF